MRRTEHVKRLAKILERSGINISRRILEEINPGSPIIYEKVKSYLNSTVMSMVCLLKWIKYGIPGLVISVMHSFHGCRHSGQLTFLRERFLTWHPGKWTCCL